MNFTAFKSIKFLFKIKNWILIGFLAKNIITKHLAFIYEITTTFTVCGEETKKFLYDMPLRVDLVG